MSLPELSEQNRVWYILKGYDITIDQFGGRVWQLNGKYHREDGPAIEWSDGTREWVLNGKRHREDGPAVERADGLSSWWLNGRHITEEEHRKL